MKKTIITILAIVIIAAAYLLFVTRDSVLDVGTIDVLVYPGSELILSTGDEIITATVYASDDSLPKIAEFYKKKLRGFEIDESFGSGYRFYQLGLVEFLASTHMSDEEITDWVKDNKGVVPEFYLLSDNIALIDESLQPHKEEIEGKSIIFFLHF